MENSTSGINNANDSHLEKIIAIGKVSEITGKDKFYIRLSKKKKLLSFVREESDYFRIPDLTTAVVCIYDSEKENIQEIISKYGGLLIYRRRGQQEKEK